MMNGVAILSALPESLDEIRAGAEDRAKDYIRTQLLVRLHTPESAWDIMNTVLGDMARDSFAWCRAQGATVRQKAGLAELRESLATHELVVVLAHWKGPLVHRMDLPDSIDELKQIQSSLDDVVCAKEGVTASMLRKSLKSSLNKKIESWLNWLNLSSLGRDDVVIGEYYGQCLARERLNARLGRLIVPGARLELSDGLWSAQEVAACFPFEWDGICDFSCCRSLYLSDIVKAKTRQGLIRADARYLKPKKVFEALNHNLGAVVSGTSYLDAAHAFEKL